MRGVKARLTRVRRRVWAGGCLVGEALIPQNLKNVAIAGNVPHTCYTWLERDAPVNGIALTQALVEGIGILTKFRQKEVEDF